VQLESVAAHGRAKLIQRPYHLVTRIGKDDVEFALHLLHVAAQAHQDGPGRGGCAADNTQAGGDGPAHTGQAG
jgi:hypothetical protein